jgi:AbrB family looped-hinge helix DNA binding protein
VWVLVLTETTYHKKKIYVPAEVRERLGLRNGDRLSVVSLDGKGFRVELKRKTAEERIIEVLANSREVGVPAGLTRREIYEDIG